MAKRLDGLELKIERADASNDIAEVKRILGQTAKVTRYLGKIAELQVIAGNLAHKIKHEKTVHTIAEKAVQILTGQSPDISGDYPFDVHKCGIYLPNKVKDLELIAGIGKLDKLIPKEDERVCDNKVKPNYRYGGDPNKIIIPLNHEKKNRGMLYIEKKDGEMTNPFMKTFYRNVSYNLGAVLYGAVEHQRAIDLYNSHKQTVRDLTHDIKSPANGIDYLFQTLLNFCQDNRGEISENRLSRVRSTAEQGKTAISKIQHIVQGMLGLEEIDSMQNLTISMLVFNEEIKGLVSDYSAEAKLTGKEYVLDLSKKTYTILGNGKLIHRVLDSLLYNPISHAESNSKIYVHTDQNERYNIFGVKNKVPKDREIDMKRIFDPFFTTNKANGGTGLGLAFVKAVVEKHGGYAIANRTEHKSYSEFYTEIGIPREYSNLRFQTNNRF